jgi:hypothetical protein
VTASPAPRRVSPGEIADLTTCARRLTETSTATDPSELAAYLATKTDVLARIAAETDAAAPRAALPHASLTDPGDSP